MLLIQFEQVASSLDWTQLVKDLTSYLAVAIEVAAGVVIGISAIQAIVRALFVFVRPTNIEDSIEAVRLRLGRWLSLALEFAVAADILRTAVARRPHLGRNRQTRRHSPAAYRAQFLPANGH